MHFLRALHFARRLSTNSFPDSVRPDLFYHLLQPPTPYSKSQPCYATSFLPSYPTPASKTIIGWLPALTSANVSQAQLSHFEENPEFRAILHSAIQDALRNDLDEIWRNTAVQTQHGWMHIHDSRNIPPLGRIGDVDDIIATVLVENSKIIPETYQPMPSYRLCTSDGLTQLTQGLMQALLSLLIRTDREEKSNN